MEKGKRGVSVHRKQLPYIHVWRILRALFEEGQQDQLERVLTLQTGFTTGATVFKYR